VSTKDVPAPPVTWTGFYIGGHIGGAWADLKTTDVDQWWSAYGHDWNTNPIGVIGGGQAGYNYQTGAFVIGFEADFGGTGFSNSANIAPFLQINSGAGFYADVTGRLGYAAGPALFYVKGGWATAPLSGCVRSARRINWSTDSFIIDAAMIPPKARNLLKPAAKRPDFWHCRAKRPQSGCRVRQSGWTRAQAALGKRVLSANGCRLNIGGNASIGT
jgi:hypothetical protein